MENSIYWNEEFKKYLEYRHRNYTEATKKYYSSLIDRFIRIYNDDLTFESVDSFVRGRERKGVNWTKNEESGSADYLNVAPRKFAIIVYLQFKNKDELINKVRQIKSKDLVSKRKPDDEHIRTFDMNSQEDIYRFNDFLIENFDDLDQLMYKAMFETASRISGMIKLKVQDILWDSNNDSAFLRLYKKGGDTYKRPIRKTLFEQLNVFVKNNKLKPNSFIFRRNGETESTSRYRIWSELKNSSKKFKLIRDRNFGISPHYVRHARADNAYTTSNHELRFVQKLLNHKSVATTEIYLNKGEEDDEAEIARRLKKEKFMV